MNCHVFLLSLSCEALERCRIYNVASNSFLFCYYEKTTLDKKYYNIYLQLNSLKTKLRSSFVVVSVIHNLTYGAWSPAHYHHHHWLTIPSSCFLSISSPADVCRCNLHSSATGLRSTPGYSGARPPTIHNSQVFSKTEDK